MVSPFIKPTGRVFLKSVIFLEDKQHKENAQRKKQWNAFYMLKNTLILALQFDITNVYQT